MSPAERIPDMTLTGFAAALGSRTPSPGGGAVAALAGSMGAGLLLMIAEYSEWPAGAEDPRPCLRELSNTLLKLAQEDAEAYAGYSAARGKRKDDQAGYAKALEAITTVPLKAAEAAVEALERIAPVLGRAPKWFGGDAAIAASSLKVCYQGALVLCRMNLAGLKEDRKPPLASRLAEAERRFETVERATAPRLLRALPGK